MTTSAKVGGTIAALFLLTMLAIMFWPWLNAEHVPDPYIAQVQEPLGGYPTIFMEDATGGQACDVLRDFMNQSMSRGRVRIGYGDALGDVEHCGALVANRPASTVTWHYKDLLFMVIEP